jgi:hypothetical protein
MAATNGCEAWSTALFGTIQVSLGYPIAIYCLTAISTVFGFGIFLLLRVYPAISHLSAEGR